MQMLIHYMESSLILKNNKIIIITGPTGVGKTSISVNIAQYMPEIEIISADSMQIYNNLNIGTDKPNHDILSKYVHHCIDLVEPTEIFNVMRYSHYAMQCIKNIYKNNKKPLIVGGSGLYIKSIIDPIFEGPGSNAIIRSKLTLLARNKGNEYLYNELRKKDAEYAKKISINDTKRIIRALEVFYLTGKTLSDFHKKNILDPQKSKYNFYIICIYMNRKKLYTKINQRVDRMIDEGLIEETRALIDKYGDEKINAIQALGYRQAIKYIRGYITKDEAIQMIKKETRNFAKRQLSWFKNQMPVNLWMNLDEFKNIEESVDNIIKIMKDNGY